MKLNYKQKQNAGFTLVEIIIVIALIGVVMGVSGVLLNFSINSEKKAGEEYDIQSEMRSVSETITNAIRDTSVAFTLTNEVFNFNDVPTDTKNKPKNGWNYFGLENNSIVKYMWIGTKEAPKWDKTIIIPPSDDYTYSLYFKQKEKGTKLLEFNLEVTPRYGSAKSISIKSEVEAVNSLFVEDTGSPNNPSIALAYRNEEARPIPGVTTSTVAVDIAISLVLDVSRSMSFDMKGYDPDDFHWWWDPFESDKIRMNLMKEEAKELVDTLAGLGSVKISIISFSDSVMYSGGMEDASLRKDDLKAAIGGLVPLSGTNTGDGLRHGYYKLIDYNAEHPNDEIVNYIILLTDGRPTYRSGKNKTSQSWAAQTERGPMSYLWGTGYETNSNIADSVAYVQSVSTILDDNPRVPVKVFVIGFSANPTDREKNEIIAGYCKGTYASAEDGIQLQQTFRDITKVMLEEKWHIYGPF